MFIKIFPTETVCNTKYHFFLLGLDLNEMLLSYWIGFPEKAKMDLTEHNNITKCMVLIFR